MPSWFKGFRQQSLLGIDIGTTGIKLVELARKGKQYELLSFAVVPYTNGQMIDPMLPEEEVVSTTLQEAVKIAGCQSRRGAIAVNSASVISRVVEVPVDAADDEVEQSIRDQADQIIPYSLDDVILDYSALDQEPRNGLQSMFLVAARRDQVDTQERLLLAAGLECRLIDVDTFAIGRSLQYSLAAQQLRPAEGLIMLLDIGAMRSVLYAFDGERVVYSREHDFGDHQLRQPPVTNPFEYEEYGESSSAASGAMNEAERYQQLLGHQLERALELFAEAQPESLIGCLVLAGGGACQKGLTPALSKHLQLKVVQANPLAGVKRPGKLDAELQQRAPSLMTACGLAMRVGQEWGS
ncbi:type IV pilus assembly protein PilM [Pokkaliibacter plantistimulans]|uniref:type IV pilus biogenesis protein PilM n=1 Tax=Pokkaliibacter plantistimulans TaxID=1635171 RepID=UPI002697E96F|nr:type IV pilus assembly protein PilM [Pokkaliibacter plantistimulans]